MQALTVDALRREADQDGTFRGTFSCFGALSLSFRGAGFRLLPEAGGARVVPLLVATVTL